VQIRAARPQDAVAIAAIYNEGIEEREATFETRAQQAADVAPWIERGEVLPVLVAEEDGRVLGWAKLGRYSERAYYDGVAEASVFVARAGRRRGAGRALMERLHDEAEAGGVWKLIALIFPENGASVSLFHGLGYRDVGTFHRHGRLDGAWRDVLLLERSVGDGAV
jgi:phosphinothricin acetyltransferase